MKQRDSGHRYMGALNDIVARVQPKAALLVVHGGNEGTGTCVHRTANADNLIQDAIETRFLAESLRDFATQLDSWAHEYLEQARAAGQVPTQEQLDIAFPKKGQS